MQRGTEAVELGNLTRAETSIGHAKGQAMVVRHWEARPLRGQLLKESIITQMLWSRALCTRRFTVRQTVH